MRNAALLLSLLLTPTGAWAQSGVEAARHYREEHGARILRDFVELLRIPNVASDTENIRRNAETLAAEFGKRGAEMKVLGNAPQVVLGRLDAPGATRTLGIYVHYDGQPVQEELWTHPPFEPVLLTRALEDGGTARPLPADGEPIDPEWRLYARSAGDDKAPFAALLAALDALAAAGIERTSNLVFLFEGEEEAGSPNLGAYLELIQENGLLPDADLWLICDGPMHQSKKPQLVFGVRGVTGLELTVYGANRSLHSGHYGNWAPNPALLLAQLLASMKDEDGNVVVAGFFDSALPLGEEERAALRRLPSYEESLKAELGLARTEGGGAPLAERLLLPSLNIRGLASAGVGDRAKNVIPATATAALDIRLVQGNDPDTMIDLVEAHITKMGFHIVRAEPDLETRLKHERIVRITRSGGYRATRTRMDHPLVPGLVAASEAAAGEPPLLVPSLGGSLPLYLFEDILKAPMVIVPIANHDDNQHAPDENLRLGNLWYGVDLYAGVLTLP